MKRYHSLAFSICLTGAVVAAPFVTSLLSLEAEAQVQTQIQPQQDPVQQYRPSELSLPEEERSEKQKIAPESDAEKVKIDAPEPGPSQKLQSPQFMVEEIEVTGVTIFEPDVIEQMIAEYEGQNLTLEELGTLVDDLNKLYRDQGYLTTQAYIPPQDIEGGKVKIEVLEGKIGTISVSGNKFYRTWALERNIPQEPGEVLNIKDLETSLNRMNQQENFMIL